MFCAQLAETDMSLPWYRTWRLSAFVFVAVIVLGGLAIRMSETSRNGSDLTGRSEVETANRHAANQPAKEVTRDDPAKAAALAFEHKCKPVIERYTAWLRERPQSELSPEEHAEIQKCSEAELTPPDSPIRVTASRLMVEFSSGGLGPAPYWGHWVEVTGGVVNGIVPMQHKTAHCSADVLLDGSLHACVVGSQLERSKQLEIGQSVTVVCIAAGGDPSGSVFLENCHMSE
jgi:hypothetical protein